MGEPSPWRATAPVSAAQIVEMQAVSRTYVRGAAEVRALVDFTMSIAPGEMVALVGPSGCGKSTCLNLLSGVDRADSGVVRVCGLDLAHAPERDLTILRRRKIGIVFQAFHLVPHLTVFENVSLPLALDGRRDPERVRFVLEKVGLAPRASHFPDELSGGEQQRAAVARAVVHAPLLILADEPTGNLDSQSGAAVLELLNSVRRDERAALVIATHDPSIAAQAERRVHLSDGRLVRVDGG